LPVPLCGTNPAKTGASNYLFGITLSTPAANPSPPYYPCLYGPSVLFQVRLLLRAECIPRGPFSPVFLMARIGIWEALAPNTVLLGPELCPGFLNAAV
jgi:hypothetical protein